MTSDNKSVMAFNLSFMMAEKELLKEAFHNLFTWLSDGSLKIPKVTEFSLRDAGSAHRTLESGNTVGKLVLLSQEEKVEQSQEQQKSNPISENSKEDETSLISPQ